MKRILVTVLISVAVFIAAFLLGNQTGEIWGDLKREKRQKEMTAAITEQMGELDIGDTLNNHIFEVLSGDSVMLKSLFHEKSVLIVVQPGCPSCLEEIQELAKAIRSEEDTKYFAIISSDNPRILAEMQETYNVTVPILYDHRRVYLSQYNIFTFPFNITIDKNGVVLDMMAGSMLAEDFREIIEYNQKRQAGSG